MKRLLFVILAIVLPPVAVGILEGLNLHFWINLILWLTLFGAIIHALFLVLTRDYPQFH